jgi:hypothetical protein
MKKKKQLKKKRPKTSIKNINNDNLENNEIVLPDYPKINKKEKLNKVKIKFLIDNYKKN